MSLRETDGTPKMKLVQAWIEIHRDDLMADWKMAVEGQQPFNAEAVRPDAKAPASPLAPKRG